MTRLTSGRVGTILPMTSARSRGRWVAATLVLAVPLTLAAPGVTLAAVGDPVGVTFSPSTKTIEYGQYWEMTATLTNIDCLESCGDTFDFIINSASNGELVESPIFDNAVFVTSFDPTRNLPPGNYEITGQMQDDFYEMDSGNQPASLTIAPAALDVEATVIPDPLQPSGAIVSAQLVGDYVSAIDECFGSTECHPQLPNGTWTLTVRNGEGETVHEEKVSTKGKASRYVSYYLHDVTPASDYSVDAAFAPASDSAANFTLKPALDASFRSADAPESGDPDAPETPDVEVEVAASPTLPFWLVVVGIGLVVALAAAVLVFWLLLRRRRASSDIAVQPRPEGGVA